MTRRSLPVVLTSALGRLTSQEAVAEGARRALAQWERLGQLGEEVTRLQIGILRRLSPIVDDLAELVRLELAEARRRHPRSRASSHHDEFEPDPKIVDVE